MHPAKRRSVDSCPGTSEASTDHPYRDTATGTDQPRTTDVTTEIDADPVDACPIAPTGTPVAAPSPTDRELQFRSATEFRDIAAIDVLVAAGVEPNATNCANNTALHFSLWRPA